MAVPDNLTGKGTLNKSTAKEKRKLIVQSWYMHTVHLTALIMMNCVVHMLRTLSEYFGYSTAADVQDSM